MKVIAYFLTIEYGYQVPSKDDDRLTHLNGAIAKLMMGQEPEAISAYLVHVALRAIIQYEENGTRMAADVRKFRRLLSVIDAMESAHRQMGREEKTYVLILLFRFSSTDGEDFAWEAIQKRPPAGTREK